jgi:hypothetical protein
MIAHKPSAAGVMVGLILLTAASRGDEPAAVNAKARLEAARKVYEGTFERRKIDSNVVIDPERLYHWSRRWFEAEKELSANKQDHVAAAQRHLERMKTLEGEMKGLHQAGQVNPIEVPAGTFFRLEAERTLMEVKAK